GTGNASTEHADSKPHTYEPLPRFAFVLLGAWLGWLMTGAVISLLGGDALPTAIQILLIALMVLLAAGAGWLFGNFLNRLAGTAFHWFNVAFEWSTARYVSVVRELLRLNVVVLVVYGGLLFLTYWGFRKTPAGFIPQPDQGYLQVNVQLPD